MANRQVPLTVIPEPQPDTRTVFITTYPNTIFFNSNGSNDFVCGKCRTTICKGVEIGQIRNIVFKCSVCQSYNEDAPFYFDKDGVARLLADAEFDYPTVTRLINVLQKAKAEKQTADQVLDNIAPVSKETASFIKKYITQKNVLYVIAILTILLELKREFLNKPDESDKDFNEYLQKENKKLKEEIAKIGKETRAKDSIILARSPALNNPCPCGSEKKFKRCHGLRKKTQ